MTIAPDSITFERDATEVLARTGTNDELHAKTRELVNVLARAAAEADESDALSFNTIWKVAKGAWDVGKHLLGGGG